MFSKNISFLFEKAAKKFTFLSCCSYSNRRSDRLLILKRSIKHHFKVKLLQIDMNILIFKIICKCAAWIDSGWKEKVTQIPTNKYMCKSRKFQGFVWEKLSFPLSLLIWLDWDSAELFILQEIFQQLGSLKSVV